MILHRKNWDPVNQQFRVGRTWGGGKHERRTKVPNPSGRIRFGDP